MVGDVGLEPTTPCSQSTCASQLRQSPIFLPKRMVGVHGLEPWTSTLSVSRSNQLSYTPLRERCTWQRTKICILPHAPYIFWMERAMGLEPITVCLEGRDSSHWATPANCLIQSKLRHCIKRSPLVKTFFEEIMHEQIHIWF